MLDKQSRNLCTNGIITRTMVVNIKSMAHVCSNAFLSIFLRRETIVFWKMSLLHWLTKLTHQTLYREKTIGEVLWRQWRHGDFFFIAVAVFITLLFLLLLSPWLCWCSSCHYWCWCDCRRYCCNFCSTAVIIKSLFCFFNTY